MHTISEYIHTSIALCAGCMDRRPTLLGPGQQIDRNCRSTTASADERLRACWHSVPSGCWQSRGSGDGRMDHVAKFESLISAMKLDGRYRTFIELERLAGEFPMALWHAP